MKVDSDERNRIFDSVEIVDTTKDPSNHEDPSFGSLPSTSEVANNTD